MSRKVAVRGTDAITPVRVVQAIQVTLANFCKGHNPTGTEEGDIERIYM